MFTKASGTARTGFTMIELLVVVTIIAVLMGLIITTAGVIRKNAAIQATRTLIQGIEQGLNRFYTEFGVYPPSNADDLGQGDVERDSLFKYLCTSDRRMIETSLLGKAQPSGKSLEPFLNVPDGYLRKEGNSTYIVDAWGTPIVYLNCKEYTDTAIANNPAYTDDGKCHNSQSFDLYSFGPDKQKDPDPLNPVDDIINWSPSPQTGK